MIKASRVLANFDARISKIKILPKNKSTRIEIESKMYDESSGERKSVKIIFSDVAAIDFRINYFDNMVGSEAFGLYQIEDEQFIAKLVRETFERRKEVYLLEGHYDYDESDPIVKPLGDKYMADVTADDIKLALVPVAEKSSSVYKSVNMLYKCIFDSAVESNVISHSPCLGISWKGGKPKKEREALTDEQAKRLLSAIKGLPPYVFVMIGLYAGLRREEILGLQWDCVHLDAQAPYLSVRRAWHSEHNRPVISTELKTPAARRDVPLPDQLVKCLREAKKNSKSDFVVANRDGGPLSYTQFKRVWQYIVTRSTKERTYVRYINGQKITKTVTPVLGEKAAHNGNVVYSLDFQVTPHQLRHTYITNLIHASVDPKTVQYLAGHENSQITMDIYAKVKYNKPEQLLSVVNGAFSSRPLVAPPENMG